MDEVARPGNNSRYRQQLIDAYLRRAGSFRKGLVGLLAFTALFGFLVAWPYLATVQQEQAFSAELTTVNGRLAALEAQQARFAEPSRYIGDLGKAIDQGPGLLRARVVRWALLLIPLVVFIARPQASSWRRRRRLWCDTLRRGNGSIRPCTRRGSSPSAFVCGRSGVGLAGFVSRTGGGPPPGSG